jgi:3-hydroxybutyryl-CoA dehydrogenase
VTDVGLVGTGLIGSQLVRRGVDAGYNVRLLDRDRGRAEAVAREVTDGTGAARVNVVDDYAALAGCTVLVEAVNEDRACKDEVLAGLASVAVDGTVLLTTTSSHTVTDLASALAVPGAVVGFHVMPETKHGQLVEIAAGERTASSSVERAEAFAAALGLRSLTVGDRPGRIARRLLMPFLNQIVQALDDSLVTPSDVDRIVTLGLGHEEGPLSKLNRTGIDDHLAATGRAHELVHDPALAPPPLLVRMVSAGRYGDKSGWGFEGLERP